MEQQIREDIWNILKNVYGLYHPVPESDNQLKFVDTMTKYVIAKTNGGPISTNVITKAADLFSSNFGQITKRRGRPAGSLNKKK